MNRLVAFGCSTTYGHGLPDCFVPPTGCGSTSSKFAWPEIVASKLNIRCINTSRSGASNLFILDNILNFNYRNHDIVCVIWTRFTRDTIFNKDYYTFLPDKFSKNNRSLNYNWSLAHTDFDLAKRSWMYIHLAYLHLLRKNIKFVFYYAVDDLDFFSYKPNYIAKNIFKGIFYNEVQNLPLALDNAHPGVEAQEVFSEIVLKDLTGC